MSSITREKHFFATKGTVNCHTWLGKIAFKCSNLKWYHLCISYIHEIIECMQVEFYPIHMTQTQGIYIQSAKKKKNSHGLKNGIRDKFSNANELENVGSSLSSCNTTGTIKRTLNRHDSTVNSIMLTRGLRMTKDENKYCLLFSL